MFVQETALEDRYKYLTIKLNRTVKINSYAYFVYSDSTFQEIVNEQPQELSGQIYLIL